MNFWPRFIFAAVEPTRESYFRIEIVSKWKNGRDLICSLLDFTELFTLDVGHAKDLTKLRAEPVSGAY